MRKTTKFSEEEGEKLHVEARGVESSQIKITQEGVNRNIRRRIGMQELSMVFPNRLVELACYSCLCAVHHE